MKVCSYSPQRQNKSILSFLAPPHQPASAKAMLDNNPGKSAAVGLLLFPPQLQTLLPSPDQVPPALFRQAWSSGSATGAETNGTGPDGCLPELDMFSPVAKLCLWYMCFCAEVFFFCSHTVQWSIVWGLMFFFFFSPLFPHVNAVFFFHSLSSCSVYPVVRCMFCMYEQVDG